MILIVSHRRSGTHLLIDALRINLNDIKDYYISLKELKSHYDDPCDLLEYIYKISENENILIKCHLPLNTDQLYDKILITRLVEYKDIKIIHLIRDPLEVMLSMAQCEEFSLVTFKEILDYCHKPSIEFNNRDLNNIDYWYNHYISWNATVDKLKVNYYDLYNNYQKTIDNIGVYTNIPRNSELVDLRIPFLKLSNIRLTTVKYFNNSVTGKIDNNLRCKFGDYINDRYNI